MHQVEILQIEVELSFNWEKCKVLPNYFHFNETGSSIAFCRANELQQKPM